MPLITLQFIVFNVTISHALIVKRLQRDIVTLILETGSIRHLPMHFLPEGFVTLF